MSAFGWSCLLLLTFASPCLSQAVEESVRIDKIVVVQGFDPATDKPAGVFVQLRIELELTSESLRQMDFRRSQPESLHFGATAPGLDLSFCGGVVGHGAVRESRGSKDPDFRKDGSRLWSTVCFYAPKALQEDTELKLNVSLGASSDRTGRTLSSTAKNLTPKDLEKPATELTMIRSNGWTQETEDSATGAKGMMNWTIFSIPSCHSEALASRRAKILFGGVAPDLLTSSGGGSIGVGFAVGKEINFGRAEIQYPHVSAVLKCQIKEK
jgi:hypothetical protein